MREIELIWLKETDSTNSLAARELANNPDIPEWRVWATEYQSAGRGQRGNKWVGKPGCNLAFTILLRPDFLPPAKQFAISQICALGVSSYFRVFHNLQAEIKWPNDIYIGNRKICGMLIENSLGSGFVSIAGIGININQRNFDKGSATNPTSLALELLPNVGEEQADELPFDIRIEQERVLECIWGYYCQLAWGGEEKIAEEYMGRLYRREGWHLFEELPADYSLKPVTFSESVGDCAGNVIEARIVGIDNNANLLLQQRNGMVKGYAFKEIRYILEE